ncbi:hypothetical protein ACLMJK_005645 [Lecanora helva]
MRISNRYLFPILWIITNVFTPAISTPALTRRNFQYKLPDGYTVERSKGSGGGEGYSLDIYSAALIAMLNLAYEPSNNLTDPVSYPFVTITLNITGADAKAQYYRQYALYTLYHALETMTSTNDYTFSNFTLQNKAGSVACRVSFGDPSIEWQQLVGGFSGGLSPREIQQERPEILESRQFPGNLSAALEKLTPLWLYDWYGPKTTEQDIFMALATLIVKTADIPDKDTSFSYETVEDEGYHLNVTNVPLGPFSYLTGRGVLNVAGRALREVTKRLNYGIPPISNFETTLVWTNGTDVLAQHVLRYEGRGCEK